MWCAHLPRIIWRVLEVMEGNRVCANHLPVCSLNPPCPSLPWISHFGRSFREFHISKVGMSKGLSNVVDLRRSCGSAWFSFMAYPGEGCQSASTLVTRSPSSLPLVRCTSAPASANWAGTGSWTGDDGDDGDDPENWWVLFRNPGVVLDLFIMKEAYWHTWYHQ